MVATLTLKNSSRLFEKIPKNLILSISGTEESAASCKTLWLNDSQLISRLIILFGLVTLGNLWGKMLQLLRY